LRRREASRLYKKTETLCGADKKPETLCGADKKPDLLRYADNELDKTDFQAKVEANKNFISHLASLAFGSRKSCAQLLK